MVDWGALPPEINSGRIYAGPGSAPLLAAAAAWEALASELQTTAASYASTIAELTTSWHGPSSQAAADAAAPYTAWLSTTATLAEQTASQAQAAAAAYEAAFAASIPPPVIAANRALLAALVATNFLGQNTPAIAATEATYAEFWAQDAGAMYGYAAAASTASQLTPFTPVSATTNDSAQLNTELTQLGAQQTSLNAAFASLVPAAPALTGLPPWVTNGITVFNKAITTTSSTISTFGAGPWSPVGLAGLVKNWWQVSISIPSLGTGIQGIGPLLNPKPVVGALSPLLHSGLLSGSYAPPDSAPVAAATGRAGAIGSLSVPAKWAAAVPAVRAVAAEMDATAIDAAPEMGSIAQNGLFGETALSSLAGRAIGGPATRAVAGQGYRVPGAVAAAGIATSSTIIVIPPSAE